MPNSISAWGAYSAGLRGLLLWERRGGNGKGRGQEGEATLPFLSSLVPSLRSMGREGKGREGKGGEGKGGEEGEGRGWMDTPLKLLQLLLLP